MDQYESEIELLQRSREERRQIVAKYDKGRESGAKIDDWEDPSTEIYHTQDRYGFIHDNRLPDVSKRDEREKKQIDIERERATKWANMMNRDKIRKFFEPQAKYREKMITRIYKGVPDMVRGQLWYILLDIEKIKEVQSGVYAKMRDIARKHSPDIRQIDLDVNRTYRDHIMFRERYNPRQQALFHVLAAYSVYNTEIGYCQGMSQIAALLLMYLVEEEDAFWGLHNLMVHPTYAMHGFFIHGFPKLIRFQAHHDKVLKKFEKNLKRHMDKQGIESGIYTIKWFFQCFLDRIPFSLTLRVWDLYLLKGERILIAMSYTILWIHRRKLMKMQMDELIEHLQMTLAQDFGYEDDKVIDTLREKMHDLISHRMDHPGKTPPEEEPTKPFGMEFEFIKDDDYEFEDEIPQEKKPKEWTVQKEAGLRTGFTEKEREISHNAILSQQTMNNSQDDIDEEDGPSESFDESSNMRPLRSTSTGGGIGNDFDTSFDASDIIPNLNNGRSASSMDDDEDVVHILQGGKSPLPPSEAQDRLDNSLSNFEFSEAADAIFAECTEYLQVPSKVKYDIIKKEYMLQSASDISPKSSNDKLAQKRPRSHYSEMNTNSAGHQQNLSTSGQKLDTSFESYFGVERSASNSDVVRIRVPYSRDDALSQLKKTNSQDLKNTNTTTTTSADQNKIRIRVPKNSDGTTSSMEQLKNSSNGNNGTLEHDFNSKISLKNHNRHQHQHRHANNSNSKSMTNL